MNRGPDVNINSPGTTLTPLKVATGDRVLLIGQSGSVGNGVYVVGTSGTGTQTLARASDMPINARAAGSVVRASDDSAYVCIANPDLDVVGTHPLRWVHTDTGHATRLIQGSADDRVATDRCVPRFMRRVPTTAPTFATSSEWDPAHPCIAW